MNNELLEKVKAFVAEVWYEPKEGLSAETSVNVDLGMDGDDAAEFMQAFSERFGVDLSTFPYDKHFGPEGGNPIVLVEAIYLRVTTGRWTSLTPLTVRELAEAAEQRRWMA
jgi:acyl carrier protein